MSGESCETCKSWAEDIYWSHFQFLHFALSLRTGYDQHLVLPKTFSDNLRKKLPEKVALKGPSGVAWNIGLTTKDDTICFMHGWQQFVKDNFLKENDFLVFKYNGGDLFDVLIFDGESLCEKAASYFIRKCGHTEHEDGCSRKRKDPDNSVEVNTPSNTGVECAAPEKSVHDNSVRVQVDVPPETPTERAFNAGVECASPEQFMNANRDTVPATVPLQATDNRFRKLVSAVNHVVQTKRRGRPRKLSSALQGVVNCVTDSEPTSEGQCGKYLELYTSNRRPITEPEMNNALQLAQAACTNNSLLIIMRPTHVYRRFYLSMPNKWLIDHLSPTNQDVILRMGKTEWHCKYCFHRNRGTGGLTGGWRNFALDNNLEEFDVCVFEPTGKINDILVMDVTIFRVVEEIAPVSLVKSPGKRGRKKLIRAIQV